jgi:probable HAF family extracellular repeat protein
MTDLGTLGGTHGSILHRGQAINASGNVVGMSFTAGGAAHAFYYDGSMNDLGVLTGGSTSWALGINDSDVVVGTSEVTGGAFHAFVYDSGNGLRDLNNLVSGSWTLTRATDINNSGQITGFGTNGSGDVRAFLLTPSCSAGGGAATATAPPPVAFAEGSSITDGDGQLAITINRRDAAPLAEITVAGAAPNSAFNYSVKGVESQSNGAAGPGLVTVEGFAGGIAIPRSLEVETELVPGSYRATVRMAVSADELSALGVDPSQLGLHVLDPSTGPPPGTWVPAGASTGEGEPTGVLGESGYVVFTDDSADYWAERDSLTRFAVGAARSVEEPGGQLPPPPLCGMGLALPGLFSIIILSMTPRRRR